MRLGDLLVSLCVRSLDRGESRARAGVVLVCLGHFPTHAAVRQLGVSIFVLLHCYYGVVYILLSLLTSTRVRSYSSTLYRYHDTQAAVVGGAPLLIHRRQCRCRNHLLVGGLPVGLSSTHQCLVLLPRRRRRIGHAIDECWHVRALVRHIHEYH